MTTPRIYLAGAIDDCSDTEVRAWREEAIRLLSPLGVLDPSRRDYRGVSLTPELTRKIVEDDLADIRGADGVLACLWKRSFGTPMELVYSRLWRIPTAVVVPHLETSPFVQYHADFLTTGLEAGCRWLKARLE